METQTSFYIKCPKCSKTALMQHLQGKYICANCSYDYTSLKDNPEELDRVLVNNLKEGSWGQLMALELHRRISLMPNAESIAHVKALAEINGIKLPGSDKKHSGFFGWFTKKNK